MQTDRLEVDLNRAGSTGSGEVCGGHGWRSAWVHSGQGLPKTADDTVVADGSWGDL